MSEGTDGRRTIPVACTLTASDLPDRIDEWRSFARQWVLARETDPTSARFLLAPGDEALVAAASLAQREKECCAFFEFSISIEAQDRWLSVSVPSGAEATLTGFADMLIAP
jgi:hypothetical protein